MSHRNGRNPDRRLPAGHPDRQPRDRSAARPDKPAPARKIPQITMKTKPAKTSGRNISALVRDYFSLLFDLQFKRYLTVQLLPLLYVVLVIGGLGVICQFVWDAFSISPRRGLTFLVASPFALLVWASACRATTEFLIAVFRMSEDVRTLAGIRPTVDRLDSLFSGNNWISRLMPFIKAFQASRDNSPKPPEAP